MPKDSDSKMQVEHNMKQYEGNFNMTARFTFIGQTYEQILNSNIFCKLQKATSQINRSAREVYMVSSGKMT